MVRISIGEAVCDILNKDNVPAAQTGRSGVVEAGEGCAWPPSLTGRLFSIPSHDSPNVHDYESNADTNRATCSSRGSARCYFFRGAGSAF
jgi:hypothetical protein